MVAAPDSRALRSLVDALRAHDCEVVVAKLNPTPQAHELTSHQREVLRAAADLGFFDAPRRVELAELARRFKVSREAVRRTLQRAERRLARSM